MKALGVHRRNRPHGAEGMRGILKKILLTIFIVSFSTAGAGAQTSLQLKKASNSASGGDADDANYRPAVSGNGRFVVYSSDATNIIENDVNGFTDIFLYDRLNGKTELVSITSFGEQLNAGSSLFNNSVSDDGRYIAFTTTATNISFESTNGLMLAYVHDRVSGMTTLVSKSSGGAIPNSSCTRARISGDGRFIIYSSTATNLANDVDDTNDTDIFVYDRDTGNTECASVNAAGKSPVGAAAFSSVSADGRFVTFQSACDTLDANDTHIGNDIFIRDRQLGSTTLISAGAGGAADGASDESVVSGDGSFVVFRSNATNLISGTTVAANNHLYLWKRADGSVSLVTKAFGGGAASAGGSLCDISESGRFVVFRSTATNIMNIAQTQSAHLYLYDRVNDTFSRASDTIGGTEANGDVSDPSISNDGSVVAYVSNANNLSPNDQNSDYDIFVAGPRFTSMTFSGLKGNLRDHANSNRDTLTFRLNFVMKEGFDFQFDPADETLTIAIESAGGGYTLQIPAASNEWRTLKNGRYIWKSPKGDPSPVYLWLDPAKKQFYIRAARFNFSALPVNPISLTLSWESNAGENISNWIAHKKVHGAFRTQ